ncbi:hypothetical protein CIG75_06280 [Tumebacillus algifaecis]|uniref:TVP38/TMEM64 family membrane protein n=1 Tax=Tumebacillus algifaecis TaxID=1214604 RepID=A0A223CZP0_9BACL|nr:TVP38/TMEM64 family protein [Tumebacillus algifaecis]ASS74613.1 hypothetical protein CIG75_06280 [Tumebacillus algifaecis]
MKPFAKKIFFLFILIICAVLIVLNQEQLLAVMGQAEQMPLLVFGLAVLFAFVPMLPYGLVGGVIGATYGMALGALITWLASTTAAVLMFLLVRYVFAEQAKSFLQRYEKIGRFTDLFERNAFLAILFARLIPIIPAAAVNIYSGLVRVPMRVFLTATALGKLPTMIIFATIGEQALTSGRNLVMVMLLYVVFLAIVYLIYRYTRKKLSP